MCSEVSLGNLEATLCSTLNFLLKIVHLIDMHRLLILFAKTHLYSENIITTNKRILGNYLSVFHFRYEQLYKMISRGFVKRYLFLFGLLVACLCMLFLISICRQAAESAN
jgi:hypothetical protein